MKAPVDYDAVDVVSFGGTTPHRSTYQQSRVVFLPVPLDRTTSYVAGTRNGPREILLASTHMELWDEETNTDVHSIGFCTLPEMELPFIEMDSALAEVESDIQSMQTETARLPMEVRDGAARDVENLRTEANDVRERVMSMAGAAPQEIEEQREELAEDVANLTASVRRETFELQAELEN